MSDDSLDGLSTEKIEEIERKLQEALIEYEKDCFQIGKKGREAIKKLAQARDEALNALLPKNVENLWRVCKNNQQSKRKA